MPAAIPKPDRRPPLTAHTTTSAHNNTAALNRNTTTNTHSTDQNNIAAQNHSATLAATIPETFPAASLDDHSALLDNVRKID